MTRGVAFILAFGLALSAFLYGGVWVYGDGFIFNRFDGRIIYADVQGNAGSGDATRLTGPRRQRTGRTQVAWHPAVTR